MEVDLGIECRKPAKHGFAASLKLPLCAVYIDLVQDEIFRATRAVAMPRPDSAKHR
jgi:hypothetical protein